MFRALIFLMGLLAMTQSAWAQRAGVGAWENSDNTMLEWIEGQDGLKWYYNWRPDQMWHPGGQRRTVEFVPMIHSAKDVNKPIQSSLRPKALLAFNEPDGSTGEHQASISVAQAISLWPALEARGLRLSSPVTTQGGTLGANSWQRQFMNEVQARGLRVDFMAVHYYSTNGNVNEFRNWLISVYNEYRRPIWVTEFAYVDWRRPQHVTFKENAAFAREAIAMINSLQFVERHAWFAANPYPWGGQSPQMNLVDENLRPTPVGIAFDQTLRGIGPQQVASLQ
ncbi:glycosyl hydrolase [Pseudophaeobacter arcticus]